MTTPIKPPIIFITGTDTGVGKTTVCGLLLRHLRNRAINCGYQKWVATGDAARAADLLRIRELSGIKGDRTRVDHLFALPASPHLAAETAGMGISPAALADSSLEMAAPLEHLIIEGCGGLMVPLNRDTLIIDLVARLSCPVLLVARSGLGTINHTLLSLAALDERGIYCAGIIFSDGNEVPDERITTDNLKIIAEFGRAEVIGRITRQRNDTGLVEQFIPIAKRLDRTLFA